MGIFKPILTNGDNSICAGFRTRGQSNLAKAALNVPHTLHAQDSVAVVVPEICRQSQNLKIGNATSPMTP